MYKHNVELRNILLKLVKKKNYLIQNWDNIIKLISKELTKLFIKIQLR